MPLNSKLDPSEWLNLCPGSSGSRGDLYSYSSCLHICSFLHMNTTPKAWMDTRTESLCSPNLLVWWNVSFCPSSENVGTVLTRIGPVQYFVSLFIKSRLSIKRFLWSWIVLLIVFTCGQCLWHNLLASSTKKPLTMKNMLSTKSICSRKTIV